MSYPMDELLTWMRAESRRLGWDLVVATDRNKTNQLLTQAYIEKFSENSYLPPISGEVDTNENRWKEVIHDFVLSVPRLSFENVNVNDSKAQLAMDVMGGVQFSMEKESSGWKIMKLSSFDPLQGPKLYLKLLLAAAPGNVTEGGKILLDLSNSEDFLLDFAQTLHEQRLGGDFFRELFRRLPDEKRVYPLGQVQIGGHELFKPQSFRLRTQSSGASARDPNSKEFGDGAVLTCVRVRGSGSSETSLPGDSYRYLIPNDPEKEFSATALLDLNRLVMVHGTRMLEKLFKPSAFSFDITSDNGKITARSASGNLFLEAFVADFSEPLIDLPLPPSSLPELIGNLSVNSVPLSVSDIVVEAEGGRLTMEWNVSGRMEGGISVTGDDTVVEFYLVEFPDDSISWTFTYDVENRVRVEYEVDSDKSDLVLKRASFDMLSQSQPLLSGKHEAFIASREWLEDLGNAIDLGIRRSIKNAVENIGVLDALKEVIKEELPCASSASEVFNDVIKFNFGETIQLTDHRATHDAVGFGRLDSSSTSFVIAPLSPVIAAQAIQQFDAVPAQTGLTWTVENVVGASGDVGTIDPRTGRYQAPSAQHINGEFTRVRVTASKPGFSSSALVTVARNAINMNMLLQVCTAEDTVTLKAGTLLAGTPKWSIPHPAAHGAGQFQPNGLECVYTAGRASGEFVSVYASEIIQVEVNGQKRSAQILNQLYQPDLTVEVLEQSATEVKLKATRRDREYKPDWKLAPGSSGTIDTEGVYRPDPASNDSYVLIFADYDNREFEGHIVLPLPLSESAQVMKLLSEASN
ncbi:hypothetical protein [Pseudomonas sp. R5(2019)]|uniref:hypothetical protein n=1 Tax=Pseudomonas sp. R5(2019) TaxID=2697566 RepID=UPI001412B3C3|nr:hypothetical protein [Pseudomonas sp. R5(2019)]NBA93844.1 hypothetical protein [Pseudomonas sp. R5(2019)]